VSSQWATRLRRYLSSQWASRLRRYFLFEAWTWSRPADAARRRATWPAWRRAIRPVGAVAFLVMASARLFPDPARLRIGIPFVVVTVCCVVLGSTLEARDRHRQGRHIGD
jgi:hypothetical protein